MNSEIICVGTELLSGEVQNSSAAVIAKALNEIGILVCGQTIVGDDLAAVKRQIELSVSRSELVVIFGGLGATADDITKQAAAEALGVSLVEDEKSLANIRRYFQKDARSMTEKNRRQAQVFQDGIVLENHIGLSPGCLLQKEGCTVVLLPGPQEELTRMLNESVIPILKRQTETVLFSRHVRVFGIDEAKIEELCSEYTNLGNPTVTTRAYCGEVDVCVRAQAENRLAADKICDPIIDELSQRFGENVYSTEHSSLEETVVDKLLQKGLKVATAESCTAGLLSKMITNVSGASAVFEMGVVAYANYIKTEALGVSADLIRERGAVCPEVAMQMANGIRNMCGADIGVGITGVAGPKASENKPVGLVYIALVDAEKAIVLRVMRSGGGRENIRSFAAASALDMLRRYLDNCEKFLSYATPQGQPLRVINEYSLPVVSCTRKENHNISSFKTAVDNSNALNDIELFRLANFTGEAEDVPEQLPETAEQEMFRYVFDDGEAPVSVEKPVQEEETTTQGELENTMETAKKQKPAKKKNGFWRSLFPVKGDSAAEKARKSVFLVALVVLIATLCYLVNFFAEGWLNSRAISDAAKSFQDSTLQRDENGVFIAFKELMASNSDIKAWIKINGTNINNPVYQTTNNDYYIDHDMNKQSSRYGALFIDQAAAITSGGNSKNVVIYGHHMRDGTMFGTLKKYTDINFYKEHSIIDFTTLYLDADYKVFSVFITNTLAEHDNGEVFNYRYPQFASEEDFLNFVTQVKVRSIIDTGVEVTAEDELLTLSTCTYEFDEARLVVMARKVRADETNAADTSMAKVNPNPLYPQVWYTKRGGQKPNVSVSSVTNTSSTQSEPVSSVSAPEAGTNVSSSAGSVAAGTATSSRRSAGAASTKSTLNSSAASSSSRQNSSVPTSSGAGSSSSPAAPAGSTPSATEPADNASAAQGAGSSHTE